MNIEEENKYLRWLLKEIAWWMANRSGYITSDIEAMLHDLLKDESPWEIHKKYPILARKEWEEHKFKKAIAKRRASYTGVAKGVRK